MLRSHADDVVPAAQSLMAPRARSVSCFARQGYMLLGRDPAWRLDPAAPAEAQAPAVAALLPAWVPLAAAGESEDADDKAAHLAADDDGVSQQLEEAQLEGQPAQGGKEAAAAPDEQSRAGRRAIGQCRRR